MKKTNNRNKRLALHRETIRGLNGDGIRRFTGRVSGEHTCFTS